MRFLFALLFNPQIDHDVPVTKWRLNAFYRISALSGVILLLPMAGMFLFLHNPVVGSSQAVAIAGIVSSLILLKRLRLDLAVTVYVAAIELSCFLYIQYRRSE